MNLKSETLKEMEYYGKSVEDICWIGGKDFSIPTDLFFELADVEYDNGYGWAEVALDLVVVFNDDSALYRCEYDGSEWWKYISLKKPDVERNDIVRLAKDQYFDGYYDGDTLLDFNNPHDYDD